MLCCIVLEPVEVLVKIFVSLLKIMKLFRKETNFLDNLMKNKINTSQSLILNPLPFVIKSDLNSFYRFPKDLKFFVVFPHKIR